MWCSRCTDSCSLLHLLHYHLFIFHLLWDIFCSCYLIVTFFYSFFNFYLYMWGCSGVSVLTSPSGGRCDNTCCHSSFLCLCLPAVGGWNVLPFFFLRDTWEGPSNKKDIKHAGAFHSAAAVRLPSLCFVKDTTTRGSWQEISTNGGWRCMIQDVLTLNDQNSTYWLSGVKGKSLYVEGTSEKSQPDN